MLSIVSVYNDRAKLEKRLLAGIQRQTTSCESILVDNCDGRFTSAAEALNWGGNQANGEWVVFIHQDVEFLTSTWLSDAEQLLAGVDPRGWHGVVGRTNQGRCHGFRRDRAMVCGDPFDAPIQVQTLDEVVLIHRNQGSTRPYFDCGLTGWHAYGVEACCTAIRSGATNTVLPLPTWHDSASTNFAGLKDAHSYVWQKHRSAFRRIHTTCGTLPNPYGWSGSYKVSRAVNTARLWRYWPWLRRCGSKAPLGTPWKALENLTSSETSVRCHHRTSTTIRELTAIEAIGFDDHTRNPRRIVHDLTGTIPNRCEQSCIVVAPDLAPSFWQSDCTLPQCRRLIVASYLNASMPSPRRVQQRLQRYFTSQIVMEEDETLWLILEVEMMRDASPSATEA